MSKPEDIPQDVWDEAMRVAVEMEIHAAVGSRTDTKAAVIAIAMVGVAARAILAAKVEERTRWAPAQVYFERYCQDEADDVENCVCGLQQHEDAKAFAAAIRKRGEG